MVSSYTFCMSDGNRHQKTNEDSKAAGWSERLNQLAGGPALYPVLFFLSLAEATVLPIPLEIILIPVFVLQRRRIWRMTLAVYLGCLTGAAGGYVLGAWLSEAAGEPLIHALGGQDEFNSFRAEIEADGFWPLFTVALSPVPFQLAQIAAGATGYSFPLFLLAAALARGVRYFGLAALLAFFGHAAERTLIHHETAIKWITLGVTATALAVWFLVQYTV